MKRILKRFTLVSVLFLTNTQAQVIEVTNVKNLHDLVNNRYRQAAVIVDNQSNSQVQDMFRQVSDQPHYKQEGVGFLSIDTSNPGLADFGQKIRLKKLPAILLFAQGTLVMGPQKSAVVLFNPQNTDQIGKFIDAIFTSDDQDSDQESDDEDDMEESDSDDMSDEVDVDEQQTEGPVTEQVVYIEDTDPDYAIYTSLGFWPWIGFWPFGFFPWGWGFGWGWGWGGWRGGYWRNGHWHRGGHHGHHGGHGHRSGHGQGGHHRAIGRHNVAHQAARNRGAGHGLPRGTARTSRMSSTHVRPSGMSHGGRGFSGGGHGFGGGRGFGGHGFGGGRGFGGFHGGGHGGRR